MADTPDSLPLTHPPQRPTPEKREAFAATFCPHLPRLRQFVRSCLGRSNPHLVDDVLQEVALRAWQNLDRLEHAQIPAAYLLGIARNVVADHFRSIRGPYSVLDEDLADVVPSPDAQLIRKEQSEHIASAIGALPEAQRRALGLRQQGLSYRQIASRLGRTEKAVQCLLARVSARLAEELADQKAEQD